MRLRSTQMRESHAKTLRSGLLAIETEQQPRGRIWKAGRGQSAESLPGKCTVSCHRVCAGKGGTALPLRALLSKRTNASEGRR